MSQLESTMTGVAALGEISVAAEREARFTALIHRNSRLVYRVAYALLRNKQDSEDVVQETFMKLFRSRAWESMTDERAFLARTTYRLALDRLPKRNFDSLEFDVASASPGPEQSAVSMNMESTVHRMIDALPEELRQVLVLSAIDELNSRQIAATLAMSEGTVRTRLMRARQLLREKLQRTTRGRHAK
ncbi:MAG TPA: RNA polymerase sigma factor [Acidobacteriaceae bacterium]|nr:RNA polymerase sigma factor [Acidobacteriaceae bacterium]